MGDTSDVTFGERNEEMKIKIKFYNRTNESKLYAG